MTTRRRRGTAGRALCGVASISQGGAVEAILKGSMVQKWPDSSKCFVLDAALHVSDLAEQSVSTY